MKPSKSSRGWPFRIKDILQAIDKIEQYTKNMTASDFKKNGLVVDAVIRNFEIIGEASVHIPNEVRALYPDVPWKHMTAMRNILIHEYFGVNVGTVWLTVLERLPVLKQQLLTIDLS
jgi:uncharacterized protein with HEPN domain